MGNIRGGMNGFLGTIGQPTAQVIDGSLKFNGSNNYFNRTPGSTGNRRKFTFSFWVKRSSIDYTEKFFHQRADSNDSQNFGFQFRSDNRFRVLDQKSGANELLKDTTRLFRDTSAWYHILVSVDTESYEAEDRCEIYVNGVRETDFNSSTNFDRNYDTSVNTQVRILIGNSRPNSSSTLNSYTTARLSQYYFIDGQALKPKFFGFSDPLTGTWRPKKMREGDVGLNDGTTWSSGIPGNVLSGYPATNGFDGRVDTFVYADNTSTMTWTAPKIISGKKIEVYAYAGNTHPILNVNGQSTGAVVGGAAQQNVWVDVTHLCPGGKLETIQAFGQQISGVDRSSGWSAVRVDGEILTDSALFAAFGTNGFYLPMDNQDDFEKDKSGNGNDFTKNNFSGTSVDPDVQKDSPSGAVFGGRGQTGITTTSSAPANYATYNALDNHGNTLSNANLTITDTGDNWHSTFGSIPSSDGRHYFEVTPTTITTTCAIGVYVGNGRTDFNGNYPYDANTYMIHQNGSIYHAASTASYQSTYSANDTVGVAVDSKNRKVWISVNGSYVSGENPTTGVGGLQSVSGVGAMPDGEIYPVVTMRSAVANINFGQKPFKYAPPQGYSPMNSASARPNKVITRPDQYVGVTTYVGNGGTQSINSLNMDPDLVWIKNRDEAVSHFLYDSVRGANKYLRSDGNFTEDTGSSNELSFIHKGFTVNGAGGGVNKNTIDFVSWSWKAGGNKNTFNVDDVGYATAAAAGLTGGDITPTGASVGTKQGFSIIKYAGSGTSGDTLPHGLSQTPDLIITKCLDASSIDWIVKPVGLLSSESHMLILNGTNASFQGTGGHISAQTSTTVTLTEGSNDGNYNNTGDNYVMYAWHNVPGLQKFGSYEGNQNADGTYVELGFRPALIWVKNIDNSSGHWVIVDKERDPINVLGRKLAANLNNAELLGGSFRAECDFLSNGFKMRGTSTDSSGMNKSDTYIYCAWAEAPAHNLFGGQSNAR